MIGWTGTTVLGYYILHLRATEATAAAYGRAAYGRLRLADPSRHLARGKDGRSFQKIDSRGLKQNSSPASST